jgi:hypothetical protein
MSRLEFNRNKVVVDSERAKVRYLRRRYGEK